MTSLIPISDVAWQYELSAASICLWIRANMAPTAHFRVMFLRSEGSRNLPYWLSLRSLSMVVQVLQLPRKTRFADLIAGSDISPRSLQCALKWHLVVNIVNRSRSLMCNLLNDHLIKVLIETTVTHWWMNRYWLEILWSWWLKWLKCCVIFWDPFYLCQYAWVKVYMNVNLITLKEFW